MNERFAYIVDGVTLWGPGPMPYFIELQNGELWEITAHDIESSEANGIFKVEQVNYKEDLDTRFYQAYVPVYEIVNGRPRETWSYHFIPAARENMVKGIDEYAEYLRTQMATTHPGQYEEYNQVYKEALEVAALPLEQDIVAGTYKYLDADVNVTFSRRYERIVQNIREAAQTVIDTRNHWLKFGGNLRTARLLAKKQISEAATDEEAIVIFDDFCKKNSWDYVDEASYLN